MPELTSQEAQLKVQLQAQRQADQKLVAGVIAGDRAVFRQLYDLHKDRIYSTSMKFLKNSADAEDASQEAFMKVFKNIATYKGNSSLSTWITKIAINHCLDKVRSLEFKTRQPNRRAEMTEIDEHNLITPSDVGGLDDCAVIDKAIDTLPVRSKTVFILKAKQGLKHEEISDLMDISVSTSKSQYFAAKALLRKRLMPLREVLLNEL